MSAAVDTEDERMRLAHERMQSGKRKRAAPPAYTKHQHDGSDADAVVVAVLPRSRVLLAVSEVTRPAVDLLCSPVSGAAFCLPMAPNTSNRLAFNAVGHLGPYESPFRTLGSAELDPVPHGLTVAQMLGARVRLESAWSSSTHATNAADDKFQKPTFGAVTATYLGTVSPRRVRIVAPAAAPANPAAAVVAAVRAEPRFVAPSVVALLDTFSAAEVGEELHDAAVRLMRRESAALARSMRAFDPNSATVGAPARILVRVHEAEQRRDLVRLRVRQAAAARHEGARGGFARERDALWRCRKLGFAASMNVR